MDSCVSQTVRTKPPTCGTLTMSMLGQAFNDLTTYFDSLDLNSSPTLITPKELQQFKQEAIELRSSCVEGKVEQEVKINVTPYTGSMFNNFKWVVYEQEKISLEYLDLWSGPITGPITLLEDLNYRVEPLQVYIQFRTPQDRPQSNKLMRV